MGLADMATQATLAVLLKEQKEIRETCLVLTKLLSKAGKKIKELEERIAKLEGKD